MILKICLELWLAAPTRSNIISDISDHLPTTTRLPATHPRHTFVCARVAAPSVGPDATSLTHTTTTTSLTRATGTPFLPVPLPPVLRHSAARYTLCLRRSPRCRYGRATIPMTLTAARAMKPPSLLSPRFAPPH
ncbi:hypothetical protein B0H13DRAFT_2494935 [Mycena leptocephala]|nr:hypothetical protein B0H13DRAFT_2494935 [Mycena leptocephala]